MNPAIANDSLITGSAVQPHSPREPYPALLLRLSELSVRKCYDPFVDIDWDAPEHALDPQDPRHCIGADQPLARTDWYAGLEPAERARFGLEWTAQQLKYGIGFEAVLGRGLLEFCQTLPNGSPEYRYAMHEVVEEGRHSMMFHEYIGRSGAGSRPIAGLAARLDDMAAHWGRTFPELFFFAVLAGELFVDDQNRALLALPRERVHPLLRRIVQIHVTEEARHVCFAENYLRQHLPALGRWKRERLAWTIPLIFADTAGVMLVPDRRLVHEFAIPRAALRTAFGRGSMHRERVARVTEPVRALCAEHGLFERRHARLWRALGLSLA